MTAVPAPTAPDRAARSIGLLDDEGRQLAAACLTGAALGSWPAFTMGVYGVIFFEQHLPCGRRPPLCSSRSGCPRGRACGGGRRRSRCCCPRCGSCWHGSCRSGGTSGIYQVLFWFGVVITVVGLPALAAVMVRLLIPGAERLRGRRALGAVAVVSLIMRCPSASAPSTRAA